jgi:hypothetical protein
MADFAAVAELLDNNDLPNGNNISSTIESNQVDVTGGAAKAPMFDDDAAATIVWRNYEKAKAFLETNTWLLEWQAADILHQSPTYDRSIRGRDGRPVRVPRFLVAKNTNVLKNQVKRALFAQQAPFVLRPKGGTTEIQIAAWTALLLQLLKRANFTYNVGLLIATMVLQGTGIGKMGIEEKEVVYKRRKRKEQPQQVDQPAGGPPKKINTKESDAFKVVSETKKETWPFFEYKRLGTVLFDPKWNTPSRPDLCGYAIEVNYVDFGDLQQLRTLEAYKNIPSDEALKAFFLSKTQTDAMSASQVADYFTANGGVAAHAEGENKQQDQDPFKRPLMLLEQSTSDSIMTLLVFEESRKVIIRNSENESGEIPMVSANWWDLENNGYGVGIGRLNGGDQRINQGVLNEALKMIGYPMNAPIVTRRGDNAPTQNVVAGLGTFWAVDVAPGEDVRKAAAYLESPSVPTDAWKMIQLSQQGGEDLVGANSAMMQGNLPGAGSSAARTATGVNRIGSKADEAIADPVENVAQGVIVRFVNFLINWVRLYMPLQEIRDILSEKHAAVIEAEIDDETFINAQFEVEVLAGAKLAIKAAIAQFIPFLLQIVQQPQLMQFMHEKGKTIDFEVIESLFLQFSELQGEEDIFRDMTEDEKQAMVQSSPGAQKTQSAVEVEKVKGANKLQEVQAKGEVDLKNKVAETALDHAVGATGLVRAEGILQRETDKNILREGIPGVGE